jgi:hypothetical protein
MDQATSQNQEILRRVGQCRESANLDRGFRLRPVAIVKKRLALEASLYTLLQIFSVTLFEKMPMPQALSEMMRTFEEQEVGNQLNLFGF